MYVQNRALVALLLSLLGVRALAAPADEPVPPAPPETLAPSASLLGVSSPSEGELRVILHKGLHPFTTIEVVCPEVEFRERSPFTRRGSFSQIDPRLDVGTWPFEARLSIPSAPSCTLYFKGGPPAQIKEVSAGTELHCTSQSGAVRCTPIPID